MSMLRSLRRQLAPQHRDHGLSLLRSLVSQIDGMRFHRDEHGIVTVVNLPKDEFEDMIHNLERARHLLAALDKQRPDA